MIRTIGFFSFIMILIYELYYDLIKKAVGPFEFLLWNVGISSFGAIILFPEWGNRVAHSIGFELPSNLIFTILLGILYISLRHTKRKVAILEEKVLIISRNIALLDFNFRDQSPSSNKERFKKEK